MIAANKVLTVQTKCGHMDAMTDTQTNPTLRLATDEQIAVLARHIANQAERMLLGDVFRTEAERRLLAENIDTLAQWTAS